MPETITIQNPHATMPLICGLDVQNNTSDEEMLANIFTNSSKVTPWMKLLEPHDRTVLLCGSGPSIKHDLEAIAKWQETGAEVWALNNCANYLIANGILADAQVIMDAKPRTIELIGPAKRHLFAAQVNPSLFDAVPGAELWQSSLGDTFPDQCEGFPPYDDEYCVIGSAISVGVTALSLARSQGFRIIHCFGYDSSNEGTDPHVLHQSLNDGDIYVPVQFDGKQYDCNIVMKMQADAFMRNASVWKRDGVSIAVHGYGLLPDRYNAPPLTEKEKYERMWELPEYREISPGEQAVEEFLSIMDDDRSTILDIGCGTGRAGIKLQEAGWSVTLMDFTANSRDQAAEHLPFVQHDLSVEFPIMADYGFCADVMEHIPTEQVQEVLGNIMKATKVCFFQISTVPDTMGSMIGQSLHLTVQPKAWWIAQLNTVGGITVHARERAGDIQLKVVSIL